MKNAQVLFSSLMVVIILVAVLKQIRGQMTEAQLAAIAAMGLTPDDFQAWLQGQGLERPGTGDERQVPGGLAEMSEEDRAAMRERFQSMTDDERATAMAELGFERPEGATGGAGGFGRRDDNAMLQPLIDLLTARAAE